ncbi:MAG: MBL fold metallo-hydrolase [Leeuwenhoekiella sp.]
MFYQFGAKPSAEDLKRYSQSQQWKGTSFKNLEQTEMSITVKDIPKLLYKQFFAKGNRQPKFPLPIKPLNTAAFLDATVDFQFVWYGHSVLLLRLGGKTLLIDPMFGHDAAPISPFGIKRFSQNTLNSIDALPNIDLCLISHDHYDHLDYYSIKKLKSRVKCFHVALGVKRHLVKWKINPMIITEFDWWQKVCFNSIKITFTPTRHFSGRGLTDRAKSLWGGWVLKTDEHNILFSGDSGYGKHFTEIGERLGPFDFGFMECGQYNEQWHLIHMYPEESVQAALDAGVKKAMPVHWGAFALAQHDWNDPVKRFDVSAKAKQLPFIIPKLGEICNAKDDFSMLWWKD